MTPTPPFDPHASEAATPDLLDSALRDHYKARCPSPHAMARLRSTIEASPLVGSLDQSHATSRQTLASRLTWAGVGLAAAVAMVVFVGSFVAPPADDLTDRVHAEIALNHRKHLASEWQTADLSALRATMDKLVFDLRLPEVPELEGTRLIGGRYCSIDGELAAQLHLNCPEGHPCTLYVLRDAPELRTLAVADSTQADIQVTTWRSNGLLFGLARDLAH